MIINGQELFRAQPIAGMIRTKEKVHGLSYGLSEVGYDFRIKQTVSFHPPNIGRAFELVEDGYRVDDEAVQRAFHGYVEVYDYVTDTCVTTIGRTAKASSIERFHIPSNLWAELRNKSTHARHFLDAALGTDMEPGWNGWLTIEMVFNGNDPYMVHAGSPILKAVFHEVKERAWYKGKYQDQPSRPVDAIFE